MSETATTINLQSFCAVNPRREELTKPFSYGDWSYATNGHILVRVPRRDDIPEGTMGRAAEAAVPDTAAPRFRPLPLTDLPQPRGTGCTDCDGRGTKHDCPSCECVCASCDGSGITAKQSVMIGDLCADAKYVRMIQRLPRIEVLEKPEGILAFRFDGGEGALMMLRHRYPEHLSIVL